MVWCGVVCVCEFTVLCGLEVCVCGGGGRGVEDGNTSCEEMKVFVCYRHC